MIHARHIALALLVAGGGTAAFVALTQDGDEPAPATTTLAADADVRPPETPAAMTATRQAEPQGRGERPAAVEPDGGPPGRPIRGFEADVEAPPPISGDCLVRGPDGWVDLAPLLRAIGRAEDAPDHAGGTAFENERNLLPQRPMAHYTAFEFEADARQRVVVGAHGEVFYSRDSGRSFTRMSWRW